MPAHQRLRLLARLPVPWLQDLHQHQRPWLLCLDHSALSIRDCGAAAGFLSGECTAPSLVKGMPGPTNRRPGVLNQALFWVFLAQRMPPMIRTLPFALVEGHNGLPEELLFTLLPRPGHRKCL